MGKKSRTKGARWEREVAIMLRDAMPGAEVKRGWQSRSGSDAPDVDCPCWWIECKVGKRPNLFGALHQAEEAAEGDRQKRAPVVVAKRDREPPVLAMRLDAWLELVGEWWEMRGR